MNIYDISVENIHGDNISLNNYKNKVLLIVNTATKCGFTPQYKELEELYEKYHGDGFEILDFPCNQFANQAPGSDEEINDFCVLNYQTKFDRFKKIDVNGENESPLYTYLKKETRGIEIEWNFTKFLIDRKGRVIARFPFDKTPLQLEDNIKELL